MESVILLLLGLLAIAVVYTGLSLRHYQRIDYSRILEQDDYARALDSRIEYLEELIAVQHDEQVQREQEHQEMLAAARREFAAEIASARLQAMTAHPPAPEAEATAAATRVQPPAPARSQVGRPRPTAQPRSEPLRHSMRQPATAQRTLRQKEIAGMLEAGDGAGEIARKLNVSRQEIDLVEAMLFGQGRTA